jgi:Ca-activated chloride channel family protein
VRRHSGRPHLPHISRTQLIAPAGAILFCLVAGLSLRSVPNSQAQNRGADQRSSIHVDVSLVSVIASVLDANNRPAPDLHQDQFEIYEEGKPQKIEVFEPETQQPLDLALMIDSSLSEIKELQFESDAAARFIAQVVRPDDRVGIFEFADTVTQLASFSGNVPQLQAAVKRVTPGDGTALYDAVYLGSDALGKAPSDRRKVLILITDAGETTSRADFETARRAALRAEALIYTIVMRPVKNENGRNTAGEHALETIADSTGGAMYYPDEISQLDAIFERINRELRTQYRLAYYPQPRPPQGSYRSIEVRVKGNYKVRYRKSYYSGGVTN